MLNEKNLVGKYFRGTVAMKKGNAATTLPDGRTVHLVFPKNYAHEDGRRVAYVIEGVDGKGFYGRIIPQQRTGMDITGACLYCKVVDFDGGEPVVIPANRRGRLHGILKIYPTGLKEGDFVQAYVSGHNGRNGTAPTTFFGTVLSRTPSEGLTVRIA